LLYLRMIHGRGHSLDLALVRGERWRAVLAFVPWQTESEEYEPVVQAGRKATVVLPDWPSRRSILDAKG
jgi:hypothetical protein